MEGSGLRSRNLRSFGLCKRVMRAASSFALTVSSRTLAPPEMLMDQSLRFPGSMFV